MKKTEKNPKENINEYVKSLEEKVEYLECENKNLQEALLLMRRAKYAPSSEKTSYNNGYEQLTLFNESEEESDASGKEPKVEEVKAHLKRRRKGQKEESIKGLDVQVEVCELTGDEKVCPICGDEMKAIGREKVREEVEFIPARLIVREYYSTSYSCDSCYKQSDEALIMKAPTPKPVMKRSLASPSSVAHVMYAKYVNALPLYRQEKDFKQIGFSLSRSVMSNWMIRCARDWLNPLYEAMKKELLKEKVILADETPLQVLKEPGKKPSSKSYMWLYRSPEDSPRSVVLFEYQSNRSGNHAKKFLKGFAGYLVTDGFAGYEKVADITRCMCFAHVRRYFIEALPSGKGSEESTAAKGRNYCNDLFAVEKALKEKTPEERKGERLLKSRLILDAFYEWLETIHPLKGSKLDKAVNYTLSHKKYLENFLKDGRIPLSNNLAENSIRPFVIGRKNYLFSDTPRGAEASATIYSIVETAKANELKVFPYLTYIFRELPNIDFKTEPELLQKYMPWSKELPPECHM